MARTRDTRWKYPMACRACELRKEDGKSHTQVIGDGELLSPSTTPTHTPNVKLPFHRTPPKSDCVSPARVVRCRRPSGRRHLRKSRVVRPRRQDALERPAPPPAHRADTSVNAGTHFAIVGQTPGFRTQEGRKGVRAGVLFLTSRIHPHTLRCPTAT